jgi:hypothetical protein
MPNENHLVTGDVPCKMVGVGIFKSGRIYFQLTRVLKQYILFESLISSLIMCHIYDPYTENRIACKLHTSNINI